MKPSIKKLLTPQQSCIQQQRITIPHPPMDSGYSLLPSVSVYPLVVFSNTNIDILSNKVVPFTEVQGVHMVSQIDTEQALQTQTNGAGAFLKCDPVKLIQFGSCCNYSIDESYW